jgi:hypothetical protein
MTIKRSFFLKISDVHLFTNFPVAVQNRERYRKLVNGVDVTDFCA